MKKIYLLAVIIFAALSVSAQCTPDNTITQPGYYPEDLDTAVVGQSYNMVLHFRIPNDTNINYNGFPVTATFDSIRLVSVLGLPSGFTYQCNVANCNFVPQQTFCAKVSGNPTAQQKGVYPVEMAVVAYAKIGFIPIQQPDTIRRFTLIVDTAGGNGGTTGIIVPCNAYGVNVYPNPARSEVTVWVNDADALECTVSDMTGKVQRTEKLLTSSGLQSTVINLDGLAKGMYLVQVRGAKGTSTAKLLVE